MSGVIEYGPTAAGNYHSVVRLGNVVRVAFTLSPSPSLPLEGQLNELRELMRDSLRRFDWPMNLTTQTVFLRSGADQPCCEQFFAASDLHSGAVTHFAVQPPCGGARLAVEA